MVFGFFTKNKAETSPVRSTEGLLDVIPAHGSSLSPSLSAADAPPQSPEFIPLDDVSPVRNLKRSRSLSPFKSHPSEPINSELVPQESKGPKTIDELFELIDDIPAPTLLSYVQTRLSQTSEADLQLLLSFFRDLTPPPILHCVRCHEDFTEVENTDRSCTIPHDDDSAEVVFAGRATKYETTYGCCGKSVEGCGDLGPPDGWCYEGYHTTDRKRARFRHDSTREDDKLISCRRKRCFVPKDERGGANERGRRNGTTKSYREDDDDDEAEEEDIDVDKLAREAAREARDLEDNEPRKKTAKHRKQKSEVSTGNLIAGDAMEVEVDAQNATASPVPISPSTAKKPKSKVQSMKPKVAPKPKPSSTEDVALPEEAVKEEDTRMNEINHNEIPSTIAAAENSKPKAKKSRPRKSAASIHEAKRYLPPKDEEFSSDEEELEKPKKKKRKST